MNEKILLNENKEQALTFQRSVQDVIERSNELINQWHQFQDFQQISSYADFKELIRDPVGLLDKFLIGSVNIKAIGPTKLNPEVIASMLNIDRESWVSIIEGKQVKTDCIPCRKMKIRKGKMAITLQEFQQYDKYLVFQAGRFVDNKSEVKEHQKAFHVFVESPEQIATYNHWQELVKILTEHKKRGYVGNTGLKTIAELTGLRYVPDLGQVFIDEFKVQSETLK